MVHLRPLSWPNVFELKAQNTSVSLHKLKVDIIMCTFRNIKNSFNCIFIDTDCCELELQLIMEIRLFSARLWQSVNSVGRTFISYQFVIVNPPFQTQRTAIISAEYRKCYVVWPKSAVTIQRPYPWWHTLKIVHMVKGSRCLCWAVCLCCRLASHW